MYFLITFKNDLIVFVSRLNPRLLILFLINIVPEIDGCSNLMRINSTSGIKQTSRMKSE
jgi:hypothetical protein